MYNEIPKNIFQLDSSLLNNIDDKKFINLCQGTHMCA